MDAYGIGCILHELAHTNTGVGESAGGGGDVDDELRITPSAPLLQRALDDFQPRVARAVPAPLAALVLALLALDPAVRPSAEAVRSRLARLTAASPRWGRIGRGLTTQ